MPSGHCPHYVSGELVAKALVYQGSLHETKNYFSGHPKLDFPVCLFHWQMWTHQVPLCPVWQSE